MKSPDFPVGFWAVAVKSVVFTIDLRLIPSRGVLFHYPIREDLPSGVDQERYFFWFSITANPQDQAADAWGCRSFAPMKMSHSMMASSPNITGKTQLETLCSYCGHNMPVTLVAR